MVAEHPAMQLQSKMVKEWMKDTDFCLKGSEVQI